MSSNCSRRDEPARRVDGVGELLVLGRGRCADPAARGLEVLLLDRGDHVGRRQPQLGQLVGPEPDAHAVVGAAEEVDLGDAGNAQELVAQVDPAVVDQVVRVVGALRGVDRQQHEDARALLLHGHALRRHLLGQARLGRRDPVLGEDVGDVLVDADLEADVELHAAVARVGRLHVDHLVDAVDLLLDRRGHRLLDRHRRGARIVRGDADDGRGEEGVLLEAQAGERVDPEEHDQDRDDDRDDRPADEELGHGLPSGLGLGGGRRCRRRPARRSRGFSSGLTCMPGRTFWSPSTMTRSPRLSPAVTM